MIKMIWCEDIHHGIAKNNKLPWHIKEEMLFFKNTTLNNIVVMGKNTWLSLNKKPLTNRINYVLTKDKSLKSNNENLFIINDFNDILNLKNKTTKDIYIIGGKQIYELFFNYADELIISKLVNDYQCDILLNYNLSDFKLINEINKNSFKVEIYQRIRQYGNN